MKLKKYGNPQHIQKRKKQKRRNIYRYNLFGETQLVLQDQQDHVG